MSKKMIPEVRFEGFEGEWEENPLSDISSKETHKNAELLYNETFTNSATKGILSQTDYFINEITNTKNINNYFIVKPDAFVYNPRISETAPVGPINRNNLKRVGVMSPLYYVFNIEEKRLNYDFLEYFFKTSYWHIFMYLNGNSGARSDRFSIKDSDLEKLKITAPIEEKEQSLVGEYFKQLDKIIESKQSEFQKLTQFKQAMHLKMFPKEGEREPEMRFKGFEKPWELVKFNEFAEVKRGLTYSPGDIADNTGVRVLRSSNINEDTFITEENDVFVNECAINIEYAKNKDILVTSANGSTRLVGKHAVLDNLEGNTVHGGFMLLVRSKMPYFLNASMSSMWYERFIFNNVSGGNGAIGNIKKSDLERQLIYIPSKEEQIKIGNFFKNLDNKIELEEHNLDKLKQFKKAMLQKMFV